MAGYTGFRPAKGWSPATIPASIGPEEFFRRYIATRTPVIIEGGIDPSLRPSEWEELPDATAWVEKRDPTRFSYGTGVKAPMAMRDLCSRFARGEDGLYLTTQPLPEDPDSGKPAALFSSPLSEMRGRFPLRPVLAGRLAPSSINLWLGASRAGSSSNLHHDFHDNFYLLLAGRKRFTIAPPSDAAVLSPHGSLSRIHPNGLINYAGVPTRADGAPPTAAVEYLRSELRRARAAPLRARLARELRAAEGEAARLSDVDVPCSEDDEGDDDSDEDAAGACGAADDMWAALTAKPSLAVPQRRHPKAAAKAPRVVTARESRRDDKATSVSVPSRNGAAAGAASAGRLDASASLPASSQLADRPPNHFSRIDLSALRASAAPSAGTTLDAFRAVQSTPSALAQWPDFAAHATLATFDILPGQTLFLPAGWWHEVVSFAEIRGGAGAGGDSDAGGALQVPASATGIKRRRAAGTGDGSASLAGSGVRVPPSCHMALNFWYHPPTEPHFEQPYPDGFAEHLFALASRE